MEAPKRVITAAKERDCEMRIDRNPRGVVQSVIDALPKRRAAFGPATLAEAQLLPACAPGRAVAERLTGAEMLSCFSGRERSVKEIRPATPS